MRGRVVIVEDGRVALIKRVRDGLTYYLFPGGGVEGEETPEQAAIREAREELGVEVELDGLLHEDVFEGVRFLYYRARIVGGEFGTGLWPDHSGLDAHARGGSHEPVWMPLGELANVRVGRNVRPRELVRLLLDSAAAHGRPQEEAIAVSSRQAPRAARHLRASRERVPELPPAEAAPPDVPDLQDLPRSRGRATPRRSALDT
ncbi:MAG: NUDIX domain-containing protein [Gaiellaceae bacterium]